MLNNIKDNISMEKIARLLIAVGAIAHLIFNYVHTNALLLLEDQICGFIMFMFILVGLVTLFESTQIKEGKATTKVITAIFCGITIFFGYKLVEIYRNAIAFQGSLSQTAPVQKAIVMSVVLMSIFAVAGILLIIDSVRTKMRGKHEIDS